MRAVVFTALAAATRVRDRIDQLLGYPKAGVDHGGGRHAPPARTATSSWSDVKKHPTLSRWRVLVKPAIAARLATIRAEAQARIAAGQAQPGDAMIAAMVEENLDATWTPPVR